MIAALKGSLRLREAGRMVVETGGVGYELFIPLSTYYRLPAAGAAVELEVRQLVREGAGTLYGFSTVAEKQAFDLLTRVQHVGPKLALAVLSVMSPEELAAAIVRGDIDRIDARRSVRSLGEGTRKSRSGTGDRWIRSRLDNL